MTLTACTDNTAAPPVADMAMMQSTPDLSTPPGPPADLGCYGMPTTHVQIINACTSAQSFDKTPFYPSLAPGGNLPPLP
ncbi:MAG TPA: hypothetical protein VFF06_26920 [Polyangia bacterium]|nr:hypothetical protein [Polyangia bacterium]